MSEVTRQDYRFNWLEALKAVFEPYDAPDKIPGEFDFGLALTEYLDSRGIALPANIEFSFQGSTKETEREMLADLWSLARQDELKANDRRDLFAGMAKRYERYFKWEPLLGPVGWVI